MGLDKFVYVSYHDDGETEVHDVCTGTDQNGCLVVNLKYPMIGGGWTDQVRGTTAATLVDTGNGFTVSFHGVGSAPIHQITLDYNEIEELRMLLLAYVDETGIEPATVGKFKRME